jgi:hypothetical protein
VYEKGLCRSEWHESVPQGATKKLNSLMKKLLEFSL